MLSASRSRSRAAMLFVVGAMIYPTLLTWAYFFALEGTGNVQKVVYSSGKVLQFLLPLVWFFGLRQRTAAESSPAPTDSATVSRGWLLGLAFGLVILLATVGLYGWGLKSVIQSLAAEQVQEKLRGFGVHTPTAYLALSLFYCVFHSGLEEYYWRWFVFRQVHEGLSWLSAATVSAVAFMAHHVLVLGAFFGWDRPWGYLLSAAVAIGGLAWAVLYRQAGWRLGPPWLSHALVDAGIFLVGYDLAFG